MTEQVSLTDDECLVCRRVGPQQFYSELRRLGFTPDHGKKVLQFLAQIYFKDPLFFAGLKRSTIKYRVTYACSMYLREKMCEARYDGLIQLKVAREVGRGVKGFTSQTGYNGPQWRGVYEKFYDIIKNVFGPPIYGDE